jgi:hypothetical protein
VDAVKTLVIAGLVLGLAGGIFAIGHATGVASVEVKVFEQKEAEREAMRLLEKQRLTLADERLRLSQLLEDAAYATPATVDQCLPVERVRRLNRLK